MSSNLVKEEYFEETKENDKKGEGGYSWKGGGAGREVEIQRFHYPIRESNYKVVGRYSQYYCLKLTR